MSLLRLALVIGASASVYISSTPPTSSVRSERVNPSFNEVFLGVFLKSVFFAKLIPLTSAIFETLSTVSFYIPDEHVPSPIRSFRGVHPTDPPSVLFAMLGISCVLGAILRVVCYRTLGEFFTFNLSIRKSHSLVTTGPYAYVRHPSYTAVVMIIPPSIAMYLLPESFMQTSGLYDVPAVRVTIWIWVMYSAIGVASCLRRISDEDKVLKQTFGKEWESWAARVKYRLIPGVY